MFEKFKSIDWQYWWRGSFWVYLRQGTEAVIGLLLISALARNLSPEDLGLYQLSLSTLGLFSIFALPGMNTALTRSTSKQKDGSYIDAIAISFKWSLVSVFILGIYGLFNIFTNQFLNGVIFLFAAVTFPLLYSLNSWEFFLQGKQKFKLTTKWATLKNVIISIILIILTVWVKSSVLWILIVYMLLNGAFNLLWFIRSLELRHNNKKDLEMVSYGYMLTKTNIVGIISSNIDKIAVGYFIGLESIAVYKIAIDIGQNFKKISKNIYILAFPKISRSSNVKKYFETKNLLFIFTASLSITIIILPIIPLISRLLFTVKYSQSAFLAQIFILAFPFWMVNSFLLSMVETLKLKRAIWLINIVPPTIKLLFLILFSITKNLSIAILGFNFYSIAVFSISYLMLQSHFKPSEIS